jgi:outer membrane protein TolC
VVLTKLHVWAEYKPPLGGKGGKNSGGQKQGGKNRRTKNRNNLRTTIMKNQLNEKVKLGLLILILLIFNISSSFSQQGLTLEQGLQIAEMNSPSMKKTRLNLIRNQENLNAQNASLKSQFSLSLTPLSYSQGKVFNELISSYNTQKNIASTGTFSIVQPIIFTDASVSLTNNFSYLDSYSQFANEKSKIFSNNLSINLNQPLFTYNRTKLTLKELQLALENAQLNYAIQLLALEKEVTQAFYSVYQQQKSLEISNQAYQNMQKSYEVSKNKVDAGISPREEMFQAELNLATTRSDYKNKEVLLENAKDDFKMLIGMSLYEDVVVIPNIAVDTISIDISFAIDQGLNSRMELRQRKIDIEISQFDLIQTKAQNEFKGNLGISLGLFGNNENLSNVYDKANRTDNEQVSLSLEIPLWDWGRRKSMIKASEAGIATAQVSFEEEQNNIILDIRKVYRNLINLRNQIEIARQNVTNAQLTYDLNLEKYKNGDLTGMDLNIYQNQLSEKQLTYTNSLISYKIELLNLKIQTLYDFEKKVAVVPVKTLDEK